MTCEPIEIICEDCGRLRTSVLMQNEGTTDETIRELKAIILAQHREAQHPKEKRP
jgi:hypothetical protein